MKLNLISKNIDDTNRIGELLAKYAFRGEVLTLSGDLGAGKTTLTKSIGKGLGIKDEINSPTFNILKCYFNEPISLFHIDAYRLEDVRPEQKDIGLEEVIEGNGLAVIEWPIYIDEMIPFDSLSIKISFNEDGSRSFDFDTLSPKYFHILEWLEKEFYNA